MTKFYVMTASGGEYDDAWERNLFLVDSEEAAMVALEELEAQHARLVAIYEPVRKAFYDHLKANQPVMEAVPPYPHGHKKDFKAKAAEWDKHAKPIAMRNEQRRLDALNAASEAARQLARQLGASDDDITKLGLAEQLAFINYKSDQSFSYEELELR